MNLYILFAGHCVAVNGVLRVTGVFLVGLSYFFTFAVNHKENKRAFILVEYVGIYEIKIKHRPTEKNSYLFCQFGFATENYTINSITKT